MQCQGIQNKAPYQKICRIELENGEIYTASLIHFNPKYHAKNPIPDRWRRTDPELSKKERWIDIDQVISWELIE